jgi:hypothetical protein
MGIRTDILGDSAITELKIHNKTPLCLLVHTTFHYPYTRRLRATHGLDAV